MVALCRRDGQEGQGRAKHWGNVRRAKSGQGRANQGKAGNGWGNGMAGRGKAGRAWQKGTHPGQAAVHSLMFLTIDNSCLARWAPPLEPSFFIYFIIGPFIFYNRSVYIL